MKIKQQNPPRWLENLLSSVLPPRQAEVSLGDLEEKYRDRINSKMPAWRANLLYITEGLLFIRMAKSKRKYFKSNSLAMLKNYIKIAWRNLMKEKGYSVINVFGLSIAITFVTLVALYLHHELSFDTFHSRADHLYRISRISFAPDGSVRERDPYLPAPLGPALTAEYPQARNFTRLMTNSLRIKVGESLFQESGLCADPTLLTNFDFQLVHGNNSRALADVNNAVISESLAKKIMSAGTDPIGFPLEIMINGEYRPFVVSAVCKTIPDNSSIQFDVLLNLDMMLQTMGGRADSWTSSFLQTYVLVDNSGDLGYLSAEMPTFRRKHYPDEIHRMMERQLWSDSTRIPFTYHLQNITDIHTAEGFPDSVEPKRYYRLGGIALVVLVLACFNFTLLSVGKARRRALEIGMRKTLGALRKHIVLQFWSESILTSLVSLISALLLIYLTIPFFNELVETRLSFQTLLDPLNLIILFTVSLVTGVLAGFYPAFILSSFRPAHAVKMKTESRSSALLSRSMITIQFAISCCFIVTALVIAAQINYVKSADTGIKTEGVIRFFLRGIDPQRVESFKERLGSYSFVKSTSSMRFALPIYSNWGWDYNGQPHKAYVFQVDRDFFNMFDLKVIAGKGFSTSIPDTANVILVNESLVKTFPGEDLIDRPLPGFQDGATVLGVVQDFNFQSLEKPIEPIIISINPVRNGVVQQRTNLLVKVDMQNVKDKLATIEKEWKVMFPDIQFDYTFMRDDLHAEYVAHERWSKVMYSASIMAVFIACLGLIGFSTLYVNNKQKEIGVRKVFGSTSVLIFQQFTFRFMKIVVIGAALAIPVAWYISSQWLSGFAFRIEMSWLFFVQGTLLACAMALLVVSYLLLRISQLNPVRVLRED